MLDVLANFVALLWIGFNQANFAPIYMATWEMAVVLLFLSVVLYNIQGRRLRNYSVFLDMNEWLLWTSIGVFGVILMCSLFGFDFIFVLPSMIGGALIFIWVRFIHFPPLIDAYEQRLARQRYFQRTKVSHPETTIRAKTALKGKRRRR
jgi:hypothetical protein